MQGGTEAHGVTAWALQAGPVEPFVQDIRAALVSPAQLSERNGGVSVAW